VHDVDRDERRVQLLRQRRRLGERGARIVGAVDSTDDRTLHRRLLCSSFVVRGRGALLARRAPALGGGRCSLSAVAVV
jgi:hypothetical protein